MLGGADWNQLLADFYAGKDVSDQYVLKFFKSDDDVNCFTGEIDELGRRAVTDNRAAVVAKAAAARKLATVVERST